MQALMNPVESVKYVWMLMNLKKKNIYREITPMTRVYSQVEMVLFAFSVTSGRTFFFQIPLSILRHGDILMPIWLAYTPILFITASCFAEMAALMPAVGIHYHYCYSTIGEFIGFLIGWQLIFAYTATTLSKCKFLSECIDYNLLGGWIARNLKFTDSSSFFLMCIPGHVDILAPMLAISMAFQAAWAVKFTKSIVNFLTTFSIVVMFVIFVTFTAKMDFHNVSMGNVQDSEKFYDAMFIVHRALVGYESLSVLGEEAKNPTTTIPISIMITVRLLMTVYTILTFTIAFCIKEQSNAELDEYNPLGSVVLLLGMPWLYWIITIGSLGALWCSTYGSMFVAIRLLYAMSRDGMISKHFSKIDRYTRKPAIPAILYGLFIGSFVTFFTVSSSIGFLSFLVAKIMTTVCLLITRYRNEEKKEPLASDEDTTRSASGEPKEEKINSWVLFNYPDVKTKPTEITHRISMGLIYNSVMSSLSTFYCMVIPHYFRMGHNKQLFEIIGFFCLILAIMFKVMLRLQPTNDRTNLSFMTPYIPMFPLVAIIADFISTLILCRQSWVYGCMWALLGVVFYFSFSIRHSQESRNLYPDGTRWNPLEQRPDLPPAFSL